MINDDDPTRAAHVEEMCFIPCRRDCRLSDWTGWSQCVTVKSRRCGVGTRQRSRYLIEPHLDGGRDCPQLTDAEVVVCRCAGRQKTPVRLVAAYSVYSTDHLESLRSSIRPSQSMDLFLKQTQNSFASICFNNP